jgi:uncharacterized membrane protein (DUF485 family)
MNGIQKRRKSGSRLSCAVRLFCDDSLLNRCYSGELMNANKSASQSTDEHPEISAANARAGLVLFFVYLVFYGGFMGLAAFAPQSMARPAIGGVNLAITYGLALIFGALVVAALYMAACARNAQIFGDREGQQ